MEIEPKHEGMPEMGKHHKHPHMHDMRSYWASWCSPVGMGIFLLLSSIAAAVALHTLFALAMGVMGFFHHDDMRGYPTGMRGAPMTDDGMMR